MKVFLDIETIPQQGGFSEFLEDAKSNFKAPSTLTKAQACADLDLTGDKAKYTSKDDAIAMWVEKFAEEKAPEVAEQEWRKTSFDGAKGEIVSIAWAIGDGEVVSVHRNWDGDKLTSEKRILETFASMIKGAGDGKKPFFIGQYIAGFDLKFLFHRFVINSLNPGFGLPFDGRHDYDYFCTQQAWAGFNGRMSQDNLCKALGIEGKPDDIDGSQVWDFVEARNIERVAEYNRHDVEQNRKIYNRLTFK